MRKLREHQTVSLNVLYRVPHEEQPVIIAAVIWSAAEHAGFLRAGRETEVKRVEFPADGDITATASQRNYRRSDQRYLVALLKPGSL